MDFVGVLPKLTFTDTVIGRLNGKWRFSIYFEIDVKTSSSIGKKGTLFIHSDNHLAKTRKKNGVRKNDWTLRQYVNVL